MEAHFEIIQWSDGLEEQFSGREIVATPHVASVLLDEAMFDSLEDFQKAMHNSFEVFLQLNIPIAEHFKAFHVHNGVGQIAEDWALSDLALYVLLLSAEANETARTKAKAFAINKIFGRYF
ncbi:MAG: hypothetical protein ABI378_07905 [Chitinophagaceae bacterium]